MPDRSPIGDWHAFSENHWRLTCLIRDRNVWSETNRPDWIPTCPVKDPLETDMLDRKPIRNTYLTSDRLRVQNYFILHWYPYAFFRYNQTCGSPIIHVSLRWVYNQTCQSSIRQVCRSPIIIIFSSTPFYHIFIFFKSFFYFEKDKQEGF